jgi:fatty acid desaturase
MRIIFDANLFIPKIKLLSFKSKIYLDIMHQTVVQNFETIQKSKLFNSKGVNYNEFKKRLRPNYFKVWTDIFLGYVFLLAVAALISFIQIKFPALFILNILLGGALFGYIIAYIQLFLHEAAHYNIAPDKELNDRLANLFIGLFVGQNIKSYRIIHWDHHRYLGTSKDTEKSYFEHLSFRFIVESLTGIRAIKVFLNRKSRVKETKSQTVTLETQDRIQLFFGLSLNIIFTVVCIYAGLWQLAVAWAIGLFNFYPFFGSVRQVLEHRNDAASASIDYNHINHGIVNRLFGEGLLANTFGGAGFNRHLLHHWDPQISYTNLKEVESFLQDTELFPTLTQSTTDYITTFNNLIKHK